MSGSVAIHELDEVTLDDDEHIAVMVCEGAGEFRGRPIMTGHSNQTTFDTPEDALDFIDDLLEKPEEIVGDITNYPEQIEIKPRIDEDTVSDSDGSWGESEYA